MGSSRLPGKALADLGGKTVLGHVIARANTIQGLRGLILATTAASQDDVLEERGRKAGVTVFRGDVDDVAGRVLGALPSNASHFVRLNGDSPFLDSRLITQGFEIADRTGADFVTNLRPRTYPYGIAVEIVAADFYRRAMSGISDRGHREHVTSALYGLKGSVTRDLPPGKHREVRTVIDTGADLEHARRVVASLGADLPGAGWRDIAHAYIRTRATPGNTL